MKEIQQGNYEVKETLSVNYKVPEVKEEYYEVQVDLMESTELK